MKIVPELVITIILSILEHGISMKGIGNGRLHFHSLNISPHDVVGGIVNIFFGRNTFKE